MKKFFIYERQDGFMEKEKGWERLDINHLVDETQLH